MFSLKHLAVHFLHVSLTGNSVDIPMQSIPLAPNFVEADWLRLLLNCRLIFSQAIKWDFCVSHAEASSDVHL